MRRKTPLRLDMPGYDPRDFVGYGRNPPHPQWPGGARIAVQIALNYEAGGEHNILYGDAHSEGVLVDAPLPAVPGKRLPLTLALHDRLLGRPARARDEIARHWVARFPRPQAAARA